MTQEEKELLLKDLCGRLPYGIFVYINGNIERVDEINPFESLLTCGFQSFDIEECKPYLRPMSSMTEEENREYYKTFRAESYGCGYVYVESVKSYDWLNAHHFDYRDLIPKGLAIEVTKENNPYKKMEL